MNEHILTGLDGSNPLAFLAALGVLVALDHQHDVEHFGAEASRPRLSWRLDGVWRPVITSEHADAEELVGALEWDRTQVQADEALAFGFDELKVRNGQQSVERRRDVNCSPVFLASTLRQWVPATSPRHRRSLDWFTSFVSEGAVSSGKGTAKGTNLHFTAGGQQFVAQAELLAHETTTHELANAVFGLWAYASPQPNMRWDNTACREHALRATTPESAESKLGNRGADWLAVRGLILYTTVGRGSRRTNTPGAIRVPRGQTWPMWTPSLALMTVKSLISTAPERLSPGEQYRRGVALVYHSGIRVIGQGYGNATPATLYEPRHD